MPEERIVKKMFQNFPKVKNFRWKANKEMVGRC
jgi:hypothetical protein